MRSNEAHAERPTPTPAPGSREQAVTTGGTPVPPAMDRRRIEELIALHAQVASVDELPPELRDNPIIRAIVTMTPEEETRMRASMEAHQEAEALYGEDAAAELAALEAGIHPMQRRAHAAP